MKTTIFNAQTTYTLNVMFDKLYQVDVLANQSDVADPSTELYRIDGFSIQLKHWATFLALANEETGFTIQPWQYQDIRHQFYAGLEENAEELMPILETGFVVLMERVASQN